MDCLFCKIANKEIPAYIVAEDTHAIAFLDVHPRAAGHAVVIPRYHAPTLIEMPDDELGYLFRMTKSVSSHILQMLAPAGLTIGINHGAVSGQTIPHLHVHIIPRYAQDGGDSIHSVVPDPAPIDLDAVAKKLGVGVIAHKGE